MGTSPLLAGQSTSQASTPQPQPLTNGGLGDPAIGSEGGGEEEHKRNLSIDKIPLLDRTDSHESSGLDGGSADVVKERKTTSG